MKRMDLSEFRTFLENTFLSFLNAQDVEKLFDEIKYEETGSAQRVSRDEQAKCLYLIYYGEVILRQRGTTIEMSRLVQGRTLELRVLLLRAEQWQYDWYTEKPVTLVRLSWTSLEPLLAQHPIQIQYLSRITQSVALQRLKRDLLAVNFMRSQAVELIAKMQYGKFSEFLNNCQTGQYLVTVSYGEISLDLNDPDQPQNLSTLQAGETTLIEAEENVVRYRAHEETRVWYLPLELSGGSEIDLKLSSLFGRRQQSSLSNELEMTATRIAVMPTSGEEKLTQLGFQFKISKSVRSGVFLRLWRFLVSSELPVSFDENRTGTAILIYFLKRYGISARQQQIDKKAPDKWVDTTLEALAEKAKLCGLQTKTISLQNLFDRGQKDQVIVQLFDGFAILDSWDEKFVTLGDLNNGTWTEMSLEDFSKDLKEPSGLSIHSARNVFEKTPQIFRFLDLFQFLKGQPKVLLYFFMGGILGALCELGLPVLSQTVLDFVVTQGQVQLLNPLMFLFLLITFLSVLIEWFNQHHNNYLSNLLNVKIKNYFYTRIFNMNPGYLNDLGVSQILNRLRDVEQLSSFFIFQFLQSVISIGLLVLGGCVLWSYNPRLLLIVGLVFPIGWLITRILKTQLGNLKVEQARNKARESRLIIEHFSSADDMKTLKGVLPARWKWDFNNLLYAKNLIRGQKLQGIFQVFQFLSNEGAKIAVFFYSFHLYQAGELSLGQVMAVVMLVPRLTGPLQSLINSFYQFHGIQIVVERLNDLLDKVPRGQSDKEGEFTFSQFIKIENLSYSYEQSSQVAQLRDLNFSVQQGEQIAIVGPSGSGKSTLAYLLTGLLQPGQGSVQYDGAAVKNLVGSSFCQKVRLVEQEGRLFSGTIIENIALGSPQPDLEKALRCCQIVGMEEEILSRPGGFNSVLLHGGLGLSEGQLQRLTIARALYSDPEVLILDEATSHLDPISESQIVRALFQEMKGRTLIFLTQRIQITTRVDRVFYIEGGCLIETGSHFQLIEERGPYFEFYLKHLSLG